MLTDKQLEDRRRFLGSSDASAVMGLDPWKSASDVWLDKTGQTEDFAGNKATARGTLLEPVLLEFAEIELGVPLEHDVMLVDAEQLRCANLDARGPDFIVEAKTSIMADEWGEQGTDEVPERVIVQCHHQFGVAGPQYKIAYVPVLLPGFRQLDFRLYIVQRNDELVEAVRDAGHKFMRDFVLPRIQPDDYRPSIEVLKRVKRVPGTVVPFDEDGDRAVSRWQMIRETRLAIEKLEEAAQVEVLKRMGDAEGAVCAQGNLTYFEIQRKGYVVQPSSYRSLKLKLPKGEKAAPKLNQEAIRLLEEPKQIEVMP